MKDAKETVFRPGMQAPYFKGKDTHGLVVDLWQFKQRSALLLIFPESSEVSLEILMDNLRKSQDELDWLEIHVLVFIPDSLPKTVPDAARSVTFLIDEKCGIRNAYQVPSDEASIILLDAFGCFYKAWNGPHTDSIDLVDVMASARLMQAECPECGEKCWLEEMTHSG